MAQFVLTDSYLLVNSVDLSDHVRSITLNYSAAEVDDTAMGAATMSRLAGIKDWSLEVTFMQDFAASKVDATLFTLVGAASFPVRVRAVNTTISATNPEFQGNAILTTYPPVAGAHGELATTTVTLVGDGTLTRATS